MIWAARILAFWTGFLSLSQEILWIRLIGFTYRGTPLAFGFVLGLFLLGIALGAALGKWYCGGSRNLFHVSGFLLIISGLTDAILPWASVYATDLGGLSQILMISFSIVLVSLFKAMIFPIAHQLGSLVQSNNIGNYVSKVYFSNIIGSTLGPLVTGFIILQYISLQQSFMLIASMTLLVGACFLLWSNARFGRLAFCAAMVIFLGLQMLPQSMMLKILIENTGEHEGPFVRAIENRNGIIHVLKARDGDDYIFGGNVYDGRINIDFMRDSNWISRLFALAALQPRARRILVIGMSAGSWTRVLSAFPEAKQIDVIEINPGYTELTSNYPELRPILSDHRIRIHFDDGRRWLKMHPKEKYDLIVMNTTFFWRAYTTLLLSKEFIYMASRHMNRGSVLAYNSTGSPDVFKTAATVFPVVYRYGNFVIAGTGITIPSPEEAIKRLSMLKLEGLPLIKIDDPKVIERVRTMMGKFESFEKVERETYRPLEVITDQNMLTEFRYGRSIVGYFNREHGRVR